MISWQLKRRNDVDKAKSNLEILSDNTFLDDFQKQQLFLAKIAYERHLSNYVTAINLTSDCIKGLLSRKRNHLLSLDIVLVHSELLFETGQFFRCRSVLLSGLELAERTQAISFFVAMKVLLAKLFVVLEQFNEGIAAAKSALSYVRKID